MLFRPFLDDRLHVLVCVVFEFFESFGLELFEVLPARKKVRTPSEVLALDAPFFRLSTFFFSTLDVEQSDIEFFAFVDLGRLITIDGGSLPLFANFYLDR